MCTIQLVCNFIKTNPLESVIMGSLGAVTGAAAAIPVSVILAACCQVVFARLGVDEQCASWTNSKNNLAEIGVNTAIGFALAVTIILGGPIGVVATLVASTALNHFIVSKFA